MPSKWRLTTSEVSLVREAGVLADELDAKPGQDETLSEPGLSRDYDAVHQLVKDILGIREKLDLVHNGR